MSFRARAPRRTACTGPASAWPERTCRIRTGCADARDASHTGLLPTGCSVAASRRGGTPNLAERRTEHRRASSLCRHPAIRRDRCTVRQRCAPSSIRHGPRRVQLGLGDLSRARPVTVEKDIRCSRIVRPASTSRSRRRAASRAHRERPFAAREGPGRRPVGADGTPLRRVRRVASARAPEPSR